MGLESLQHISGNIFGHLVCRIPRSINLCHSKQAHLHQILHIQEPQFHVLCFLSSATARLRVAIDLPAVESVWAITLTFFASFASSNIDRRNSASDTPWPIAHNSASPLDNANVPWVLAALTMLHPSIFTVDPLVDFLVFEHPAQSEST